MWIGFWSFLYFTDITSIRIILRKGFPRPKVRTRWPNCRNSRLTFIRLAVDAIILAEGAEKKEQVAAWVAEKHISAYAMCLPQIESGTVIPPSGWKCANCDKTENLWLNLTDGMILRGRKNWDGTGGNNHAVEHYNETKYPLTVKLGTITADLEVAGYIG
ncbi:ubiquitin carboxyl-terminal hydrolase 14-like [Spinacia oleracea]|uniref:Ubiquitin carboxyl-terminal hydrolase 14-like n=1 Tax=Spinacia oleracea TaxID=3562 RepID=A0ABM3QSL5_SPIOL|nr:ubiquitin carboxyl-terminal hydrolase 14-like [Spinacia oleracea]